MSLRASIEGRLRRGACLVIAGAAMFPAVAAADPSPATTSLLQRATVAWSGGRSVGHDRATFSIPGVGSGDVVCRRNAAFFRMIPASTAPETSMWSTLAQVKEGATSYAVHDARVYTFSTPTSTVPHGTGSSAREGLNRFTPIEDSGSGSAFGLISLRSARNVPAGGQVAPTAFTVRWRWSKFGTPSRSACRITATFTTQLPPAVKVRSLTTGGLFQGPGPAANSLVLDWHGDGDAAGKADTPAAEIPYLGAIRASCGAGPDAPATWSIAADDPSGGLIATIETYEGEGDDAESLSTDAANPATGLLGPVPLPVNGMQRITLSAGTRTATIVLSSIRKTNDPNPADDFCEVAAQAVSASA